MAQSKDALARPAPRDPAPAPAPEEDVVLVHGRTDDGKGLRVLRKKGDSLSAGEVRPLEHGKSITGEVVALKPRPEAPMICDVEVQADVSQALQRGVERGAAPANDHAGPARVASPSYRAGWDRMWGARKRQTSEAN
jgi:hypothetical protein